MTQTTKQTVSTKQTTASKKPTNDSAVKKGGKKTTNVVQSAPAVEEPVLILDESVVKTKKERVVITRDSYLQYLDDMISNIETEIEAMKEGDTKSKGVRFLRNINKRVKLAKNQAAKLIKQKKNGITKKTANMNSGFLKPVQISKEMAKFTGWDVDQLRSRVDVTKFLCQYIREHNLQNPEDKRQIVADTKLQKLLKFDPKVEKEPLTYYRIQSHLKNHFIKPDDTVVSA